MRKRAHRLGGAFSLLALLALIAAAVAAADSAPPGQTAGPAKPGKITKVGTSNPTADATTTNGVHALGYRLTAKLAPASSSSSATGHWDGVLVHVIGVVHPGTMPSIPGCTVTGPKPTAPPARSQGIPHKIKCSGPGAVPPFAIPGTGNRWILGWRLSYSNLSSAVSGTDLRLTLPGAAPVVAATLCTSCVSGKFGRTNVTDDQASALLKGEGSIVVRTANNPGGEISGQIVKGTAPTTHG
ncbi:MAG TPA: CHRD domain-containing protein [Gaiellaceae bacterium]|nr:CHRD domain-containing protein [Gaiellaceae bacterium]